MAVRGGNDVTLASGPENCSDAIRHAGEKLLGHLMNRDIKSVNVIGCNGIGRWRIIDYAAQRLKGSELFDVELQIKLPKRDLSHKRVQMEIADQLHLTPNINFDDDKINFMITAGEICKSLAGQRFMLIIGDVTSEINLYLIGIPLNRDSPYDSKVVFVGDHVMQPQAVQQYNVAIDFEELSIDILREEAGDVAHSPGIEGCFSHEAVLHCFLYLWFFSDYSYNVNSVTRDWIAEGFIITQKTEEDEEEVSTLREKTHALLREFELRSLIQFTENPISWQLPAWARINDRGHGLAKALTQGRFWIYSPPKEKLLDSYWPTDLPPNCSELSTLRLGGVDYFHRNFEIIIPDPFFEQMQGLRVLNLDNLSIKSLPPSIACLHNLRLLRIFQCRRLKSLPSSFQALRKLEVLEISNSSSFETMPDECFLQMTNLRYLLIHATSIRSLPSSVSKLCTLYQLLLTNSHSLMKIPNECFECMQRLQILDLRGDSNLKSLPSSLSKLVNLRRLALSNCSSLKMKLLPHLRELSTLEELDLSGCNSLEDIEDVSSSIGTILPKLQTFNLSQIVSIQQISLKDCQSLEFVHLNRLTNLLVLCVSGTKIKSFPESMSGTDHIRRLDMLRMNHIREIKWDSLSTELQYLNIDQCSTLNSSEDNEWQGDTVGARIRVSNHHLLQSLTSKSKLWGAKCFSRFHVCISPCQEDKPPRQFVYANIGSKTQTPNLPSESHFDRHLEIRGGGTSPNGIHGVFSQMELLTLCDNAFVQRLSDLGNANYIAKLKECRVKRCKGMQIFFEGVNSNPYALSCLEKLWMSDLARLRSVCEGTYGSQSFTLLKHIYLECCPRLMVVFSSGVCLQSLETLQIKFCSRLEAVFRGVATENGSLQRLHTVCLWELPKLESICSSVCLPALKKLRVSGCPKLYNLPLQVPHDNAAASTTAIGGGGLKVEGEFVWWASLKLEEDSIKRHVHFRERRPFIGC